MLYDVVIHFAVYDLPVQYLFYMYSVRGYIYWCSYNIFSPCYVQIFTVSTSILFLSVN